MSRAVMQQALDALEDAWLDGSMGKGAVARHNSAITALREKLAKPEQEPFGYFKAEPFGWTDCAETDEGAKALYEAPPQRQPLTDEHVEPVARREELARPKPEHPLQVKAERESAWQARDTRCDCDHNEYCKKCWPPEFREGEYWDQREARAAHDIKEQP